MEKFTEILERFENIEDFIINFIESDKNLDRMWDVSDEELPEQIFVFFNEILNLEDNEKCFYLEFLNILNSNRLQNTLLFYLIQEELIKLPKIADKFFDFYQSLQKRLENDIFIKDSSFKIYELVTPDFYNKDNSVWDEESYDLLINYNFFKGLNYYRKNIKNYRRKLLSQISAMAEKDIFLVTEKIKEENKITLNKINNSKIKLEKQKNIIYQDFNNFSRLNNIPHKIREYFGNQLQDAYDKKNYRLKEIKEIKEKRSLYNEADYKKMIKIVDSIQFLKIGFVAIVAVVMWGMSSLFLNYELSKTKITVIQNPLTHEKEFVRESTSFYINNGFINRLYPVPYILKEEIADKKLYIVEKLKKEGVYGIIDEKGNKILPTKFENISEPDEQGYRKIQEFYSSWYYGLLDKNYKIILPAEYKSISELSEDGSREIEKDGYYGIMDKNYKIVLPATEYSYISRPDENGYREFRKNGHYGVINRYYKEILSAEYEGIATFHDEKDFKIIKKNGYEGVINKYYEIVVPIECDDVIWRNADEDGLREFSKNNYAGLLDKNFKIVLPATEYRYISKPDKQGNRKLKHRDGSIVYWKFENKKTEYESLEKLENKKIKTPEILEENKRIFNDYISKEKTFFNSLDYLSEEEKKELIEKSMQERSKIENILEKSMQGRQITLKSIEEEINLKKIDNLILKHLDKSEKNKFLNSRESWETYKNSEFNIYDKYFEEEQSHDLKNTLVFNRTKTLERILIILQQNLKNESDTLLTQNYSNGDIEEYYLKKGKKEGPATYYFSTGQKEKYFYVNGVKNGPAIYFYDNGNKTKYSYVNGVKKDS